MKMTITIDVDPVASGYADEEELKDSITDFARDLIINGAENEEVELIVLSVSCLEDQTMLPRKYKMW